MKTRNKIALLLTVTLALGMQLRAQVTIAYCKLGGGCKFYQTQYTYTQLDGMFNYLGTFEKDKGTLVFSKTSKIRMYIIPIQNVI